MHVFSNDFKYSSSHKTACKSKWFVGSSRSRISGLIIRVWVRVRVKVVVRVWVVVRFRVVIWSKVWFRVEV